MRRFTLRFEKGETTGIAFGPEGPPDLIFLHATGFNALTYRSLLEPLGEQLRIIALDQRGHGRSPLPADPATMTTWRIYARDLLSMLKSLPKSGRPPVLAGHSMGGAVSLTATIAKPSIARGLLLLDPVMPPIRAVRRMQAQGALSNRIPLLPIALGAKRRRSEFASKAEAVAGYRGKGAFATWTGSFLEDYVEDGFVDTAAGVTLACRSAWEAATFASLRHYAGGLLGRGKLPTILMKAENASSVKLADAELMARRPDLKLETVPGSTHFLPMEFPDLVRERLQGLIRST